MNWRLLAAALLASHTVTAFVGQCQCEKADDIRARAISDIPGFCRKATADHFDQVMSNFSDASGNQLMNYGAYQLSMAPDLNRRKAGLVRQAQENGMNAPSGFRAAVAQANQALSAASETKLVDRIQQCKRFPHPQSWKLTQFSSFACGLNGSKECAAAFKDLVSIQYPCTYMDGYLSLPDMTLEVLRGADYNAAGIRLAEKLLGRIEALDKDSSADVGDLYEDTVEAFKSGAKIQSEAERMALNFLAIYGTRGTAIKPLKSLSAGIAQSSVTSAAIGLVGSAAAVLDYYALQKGRLYSVPRAIKSQCDYVRPYHFWMGAYLGRELLARGHSPTAAVEAINSIGTLYEQFAETPTNRPDRTLNGNFLNYYDVETQKDILFNDLGSAWFVSGRSNSPTRTPIDADRGLKLMIEKATPNATDPGVLEKLAGLSLKAASVAAGVNLGNAFNWRTKIAPDAHLKDLVSQAATK
jgi:hypothetical protein